MAFEPRLCRLCRTWPEVLNERGKDDDANRRDCSAARRDERRVLDAGQGSHASGRCDYGPCTGADADALDCNRKQRGCHRATVVFSSSRACGRQTGFSRLRVQQRNCGGRNRREHAGRVRRSDPQERPALRRVHRSLFARGRVERGEQSGLRSDLSRAETGSPTRSISRASSTRRSIWSAAPRSSARSRRYRASAPATIKARRVRTPPCWCIVSGKVSDRDVRTFPSISFRMGGRRIPSLRPYAARNCRTRWSSSVRISIR